MILPRGEKRVGAGRPKGSFHKKKISPPKITGDTPMIRVRQATPQGLGFQALAQIPGVTIQSEAVRHPRPSKSSTYVAAKASIPAGWAQVDPQPSTYVGMNKWYAEYRRDALVRTALTP